MGDRISVQFKKGTDKSVVLFSHWEGINLLMTVEKYLKELTNSLPKTILRKAKQTQNSHQYSELSFEPLSFEPQSLMLDLIRFICKNLGKDAQDEILDNDIYLGINKNDGDNSDNGHFIFDLFKGKWSDEEAHSLSFKEGDGYKRVKDMVMAHSDCERCKSYKVLKELRLVEKI